MIEKLKKYIRRKLLATEIAPSEVHVIVNEYKNRITLRVFIKFKDYNDSKEVKEHTRSVIKELKRNMKDKLGIDKSPTSAAYGKVCWPWKGREITMYYDLDKETIDGLIALSYMETK